MAASLFSKGAVDPALDQLFSSTLNTAPLKSQRQTRPQPVRPSSKVDPADDPETEDSDPDTDEDPENSEDDESEDNNDEDELSELSDAEAKLAEILGDSDEEQSDKGENEPEEPSRPEPARKKRKRGEDADLEDNYLAKLARVAEADEKRSKRQKAESGEISAVKGAGSDSESEPDVAEDEESDFEIPKHETQDGTLKKDEVDQANRTVFLGNVSTSAIKSKESRRELEVHLTSFFDPKSAEKHKLESLRFRSVAFASTAIPRKAAFAKKDLLDATTKSTNAYVVYSSPALAKTAVQKLNGTIVLDRHLRVDSVAHPQPVDHRRCVFVGNLGFVDDESLMNDKGADDGKPKKKRTPADHEEGLWRQFGKAGTVESVRVIRDKSTRVGKGFAYVQFTDQVAVEKALEFHEKKYPPMLPRVLRVTRAKKMTKTNSYKEKSKMGMSAGGPPNGTEKPNGKVYNPKVDPNQLTAKGRATKLFGRAGAAQLKKGKREEGEPAKIMRRPEDFVFEGHRARDAEGKATMNLKQKKQKGGKPQNRSSKRGAAFKAAGRKKKSD